MIDPVPLLRGRWAVERTLRDLRGGGGGAFGGVAEFAPRAAGDGLWWDERGRVRFGGHEGPATRTLAIVGGPPTAWWVEFDDGRPFHVLDLSSGSCAAEHLCGEDRYVGEYRLLGPDELHVRWRISGPRKDVEIDSTYRRALAANSGSSAAAAGAVARARAAVADVGAQWSASDRSRSRQRTASSVRERTSSLR